MNWVSLRKYAASGVLLMSLASGVHAQDVQHLPLSADYCTILRAFTDTADPNCPEPATQGQLRSIVRHAVPPGDPLDSRGYFIRFAFDSETLNSAYQSHLQKLSSVLKSDAMAGLCLLLVGHTDSLGSHGYNQALAQKRARTVALYLQGVAGVSGGRISTESRGETSPLSGVASTDPRNRRVEILAKQKTAGSCA